MDAAIGRSVGQQLAQKSPLVNFKFLQERAKNAKPADCPRDLDRPDPPTQVSIAQLPISPRHSWPVNEVRRYLLHCQCTRWIGWFHRAKSKPRFQAMINHQRRNKSGH